MSGPWLRRTLLVTLPLAAACGGALFWLDRDGRVRVTLSRDELQARVDAKLPFIGARGPLTYEVTRARVELRPDGRIGVDADFGLQVGGRAVLGAAVAAGRLDYRDGEFFVRDFVVEDAAIDAGGQPAGEQRGGLRGLIARKKSALVDAAVAEAEKQMRANGGAIFSAALDRWPVYRLKQEDTKQALAKYALEKIEVRDDRLVATLNLTGAR